MTLDRRAPMRKVSSRKRRERRAAQPVVDAVMERDGGCVLRNHRHIAGPCAGIPVAHHIVKRWKRPPWVAEVLVTLCWHHNSPWVEDHPDLAHELGLVVRNGETVEDAWQRMHAAGLSVGGAP